MNILNKLKYIGGATFVAISSFMISGCEDQLKEDAFDFYDVESYFKNTSMLEMALNGVYEKFSSPEVYGQYWLVYDTDTDIAMIQGLTTGHVARDLGHFNVYATHSWLEETWRTYYKAIDRANTILDLQSNVVIENAADSVIFRNFIAQTKVLRSMAYFDLTLLFGDVPLKLHYSKDGDNFNIPRTPRAEVYDTIISNFRAAIPDLLEVQKGERITQSAAKALLARVYLFRGGYSLYPEGNTGVMKRPDNYLDYYNEANTLLAEIMESGLHGLQDSYEQVFKNMCEERYLPYENMCEIAFYSPTGDVGSVMGTYNGPTIAQGSPKYMRANSFIKTQNIFADKFETGDLRRATAIAQYQIDVNDNVKNIAVKQSYNWAPGKWRRNWHITFKDNNNTNVNYILMRYADVLLMRAEVENEINNGPTEVAFDCINQVRRRAFGMPYKEKAEGIDMTSDDLADKDAFFEYLYIERARELCFEGMRRMDLIRWNRYESAVVQLGKDIDAAISSGKMQEYKYRDVVAKFKTGKHEIYPIPAREIRETNNVLVQNPNYTN